MTKQIEEVVLTADNVERVAERIGEPEAHLIELMDRTAQYGKRVVVNISWSWQPVAPDKLINYTA